MATISITASTRETDYFSFRKSGGAHYLAGYSYNSGSNYNRINIYKSGNTSYYCAQKIFFNKGSNSSLWTQVSNLNTQGKITNISITLTLTYPSATTYNTQKFCFGKCTDATTTSVTVDSSTADETIQRSSKNATSLTIDCTSMGLSSTAAYGIGQISGASGGVIRMTKAVLTVTYIDDVTTGKIQIGSTWHTIKGAKIVIGGTWHNVKTIKVDVSSTWKSTI